jgi:translation elongation factor EF-1alpha
MNSDELVFIKGGKSVCFNYAPCNLCDLPDEILLFICSYLYYEELVFLGCVNRHLHAISKDGSLAARRRRNVNICVVGDSNVGKSTLLGHLFAQLGFFSKQYVAETAEMAQAQSKPEMKYAFLCSTSIDHRRARTKKLNYLHAHGLSLPMSYTFLDTPGHRDYIKNAIRGVTQAEMMVWVVEDVWEKPMPYTRQRFFMEAFMLCYAFGLKRLIVAVNKCDSPTMAYSTAKFDEIKLKIERIIQKCGIKIPVINFVPVSAWDGWNLTSQVVPEGSTRYPDDLRLTYKGPTLWEAIKTEAEGVPRRPVKRPFRMSITSTWNTKVDGKEQAILLGTVLQGTLKPNQRIKLTPPCPGWSYDDSFLVTNISIAKEKRFVAPAGHLVALGLKMKWPATNKTPPGSGQLATAAADKEFQPTSFFIAEVIFLSTGFPGVPEKFMPGSKPIFHFVSGNFPGVVLDIFVTKNVKTKKVIEENPKFAKGGTSATISVVPLLPRAIEPFREFPLFGRFVITDNSVLVGVGMVMHVVRAFRRFQPTELCKVGFFKNVSSNPHPSFALCNDCLTYAGQNNRGAIIEIEEEEKKKKKKKKQQ